MKKCENKILDNLYEIREGEVEKNYISKYGKPKNSEKTEKAENELVNFMKKFIKDKKDIKNLYGKLNKFELCAMGEMCFWYKPYYKAGFIDAISLKKQIKEEKITDNISNEDSIYNSVDDIWDYIDKQKYNNLKANNDYIKATKRLAEIKEKYPKVMDFYDNNKIAEFTQEEMKAILEIKELYDSRNMLEAEEMFKIGLRQGKSL